MPDFTYFRTLLGELLYYQKIDFAADKRQETDAQAGITARSFLRKSKKKWRPHFSLKSPERIKAAGIPWSKLVPRPFAPSTSYVTRVSRATTSYLPDPYMHRKDITSAPKNYTRCFWDPKIHRMECIFTS